MSYIIIQCKGRMNTKHRPNPTLKKIAVPEADGTTSRPCIILGAYYSQHGSSDVYRLSYPYAPPGNYMLFAWLNGHLAHRHASAQEADISEQQAKVLLRYTDPARLDPTKSFWKGIQHADSYGLAVDAEKSAKSKMRCFGKIDARRRQTICADSPLSPYLLQARAPRRALRFWRHLVKVKSPSVLRGARV